MLSTPLPSIRTIFFDAGFTLLHSSIPHICQQVCLNYGLAVEMEDIRSATRQAADYYHQSTQAQWVWEREETIQAMWINYYKHLFSFFLSPFDPHMKALLAHALYHTRELPPRWQVYVDVVPVLARLRTCGYRVGVISNWGRSLFSILSHHHLTPYMECLVVSALAHCAKPSPALFEMALHRARTSAEEALYIGDNYLHDVVGARAAGMTPILLDRSAALTTDTMDCLVIHSFYDLLDLLQTGRNNGTHTDLAYDESGDSHIARIAGKLPSGEGLKKGNTL
ncbi:MAG: HAD-IA family hydrolase [Ktedonobacteraceae bacterium]|nr:HAD-IA family hydrolase [Ktedonobacteraceae bacterium]